MLVHRLIRTFRDEKETRGVLRLDPATPGHGRQDFFTIELPWLNNEPGKSCIPAGRWREKRRFSPHNKQNVFTGQDIPGRELVNIEPFNYARQSRGCIGLGTEVFDIDGDGELDVAHSVVAFDAFMARHEGIDEFILEIIDP